MKTSLLVVVVLVSALVAVTAAVGTHTQFRPPHFVSSDEDSFSSLLQLEVRHSNDSSSQAKGSAKGSFVKNETEPRTIKGKIKLNGRLYKTVCNCKNAADAMCPEPTRCKVHQEAINVKKGWSQHDLAQLLGNPKSYTLADVSKTPFDCIDGRATDAVLGTPGGDFGEFLNMLVASEVVLGANITEAQTEEVFRKFLLSLDGRQFHFCTDEDSISHLEKNLHVNGETGVVVGLDLANPRNALRTELIKDIVKPASQGSYFLKAVLADPRRFFARKELVQSALRAFFRTLWDKDTKDADGNTVRDRIKLVVYSGKPNEKAWLNIRSGKHCEDAHKAPLFAPRVQVFVNHFQAVSSRRKAMADFAMSQFKLDTTRSALHTGLNRNGRHATEVYAEIRALRTVPFYTVILE